MKTLFSENFPLAKTDKELDALKAGYPTYDHYYIASGSIKDRKNLFEGLYSRYEPYADRHFLQEAKINFHQRSWEMYLTCVLLDNDFSITSDDKGPDIKLIVGDKTVWIECTAPTRGAGRDRVPDLVYGIAQHVPREEMVLRLSSSLKEKFERYREYADKGVVDTNDAFVIAINRGAFSHPDPTAPLIFECLLGLGDLTLPIRLKDGKAKEPYYARREEIKKKSGSSVPMNFFEDKKHESISAVIYSRETVLNHPEKIGDDCILVHNPLAKNPLPGKTFSFLKQYIAEINQRGLTIKPISV